MRALRWSALVLLLLAACGEASTGGAAAGSGGMGGSGGVPGTGGDPGTGGTGGDPGTGGTGGTGGLGGEPGTGGTGGADPVDVFSVGFGAEIFGGLAGEPDGWTGGLLRNGELFDVRVARRPEVEVRFDLRSQTSLDVRMERADGSEVVLDGTFAVDSDYVRFTPDVDLVPYLPYKVVVKPSAGHRLRFHGKDVPGFQICFTTDEAALSDPTKERQPFVLSSIAVSKDVVAGTEPLDFTVGATDNRGIEHLALTLTPDVDAPQQWVDVPLAFDPTDCLYHGTGSLLAQHAGGAWRIDQVWGNDYAIDYSPGPNFGAVQARDGFYDGNPLAVPVVGFEVEGHTPDRTAPSVTAVEASYAASTATVTVHADDAEAGVRAIHVVAASDSGFTVEGDLAFDDASGTWQGRLPISAYLPSDLWSIDQVIVVDRVDNELRLQGFGGGVYLRHDCDVEGVCTDVPTDVEVANFQHLTDTPDVTAPQLTNALLILPEALPPGPSISVMYARFTDGQGAGAASVTATLSTDCADPAQTIELPMYPLGNGRDWYVIIYFFEDASPGPWRICTFEAADAARNAGSWPIVDGYYAGTELPEIAFELETPAQLYHTDILSIGLDQGAVEGQGASILSMSLREGTGGVDQVRAWVRGPEGWDFEPILYRQFGTRAEDGTFFWQGELELLRSYPAGSYELEALEISHLDGHVVTYEVDRETGRLVRVEDGAREVTELAAPLLEKTAQ